jgi:flagellin
MVLRIIDKGLTDKVNNDLSRANSSRQDAMAKLSSGRVFTATDPRPADRALTEGMEFRLRGLSSAKRNINDVVSLAQTAEESMTEVNNIILRLKEINVAGANTVMSDRERRYLFVEYEALREELTRIAETTEFNGVPLLNGDSERVPEEMVFRVDDPMHGDASRGASDIDVNEIRFDGLKKIRATADSLNIKSAADLLADSEEEGGITIDDVIEMMEPEDSDLFATVYDEALSALSDQRATFGALQSRLQRALDYVDVYQENLSAAKSRIEDTDFASESVRLAESQIMMNAASAMLAQSNISAQVTLNLLQNVTR